jgi:hypothetical protein
MHKICFYNHFHNGDCLATKAFVNELIEKFPAKYFYCHSNHPKILRDLNVTYMGMPSFLQGKINPKFIEENDTFYINTWVGCYFIDRADDGIALVLPLEDGKIGSDINWKAYYKIWTHIYKTLNEKFELNLKLSDNVEDYAHSIDYTKFNYRSIDAFVQKYSGKKMILVSNGPGHSNQSYQNHDMSNIFNQFLGNSVDELFIFTNKFPTSMSNAFFTDDIIQPRDGSDLNEIAYLSTFCDIIIGRNSGPFLFTNTKENLNNPNKKFLAMGKTYEECFPFGFNTKCDFKFIFDTTDDIITEEIKKILK